MHDSTNKDYVINLNFDRLDYISWDFTYYAFFSSVQREGDRSFCRNG